MLSVADCPTGYGSQVILIDEMRTRFPPRLRSVYGIRPLLKGERGWVKAERSRGLAEGVLPGTQ